MFNMQNRRLFRKKCVIIKLSQRWLGVRDWCDSIANVVELPQLYHRYVDSTQISNTTAGSVTRYLQYIVVFWVQGKHVKWSPMHRRVYGTLTANMQIITTPWAAQKRRWPNGLVLMTELIFEINVLLDTCKETYSLTLCILVGNYYSTKDTR